MFQYGQLFLTDSLQTIVSAANIDKDLTARYYAKKVLRFVRCKLIAEKWIEIKRTPAEEQSYYEGLVSINFGAKNYVLKKGLT